MKGCAGFTPSLQLWGESAPIHQLTRCKLAVRGGGLLTHPNHLCDQVASWENSSSICELHEAPVAMLHECFAYGLGCIAYVLFVARFVA